MTVIASLSQFGVCAVVVIIAGTVLAKAADRIAEITGFGRLLVGSILLAGATSLPELTVDISAIRIGAPDLAVGDLLGSSLANLLILAMLDLLKYSKGKMLSRASARHALSGSVSILMTAVAGLTILVGPKMGDVEWFGVSPGFVLVGIVYVFGARVIFIDQRASAADISEHSQIEDPNIPAHRLGPEILKFCVAAVVILLVGPFMSHAAEQFAAATGLGRTFVGTTLVALSTSLPEFVASLAAIRIGAFDLAVGNVFGSNAFNMMLLLPLDIIQKGPLSNVVSAGHCITSFTVIAATQIAIIGQLYHLEKRRRFIDPDAWLVIASAIAGLALVYFTQ